MKKPLMLSSMVIIVATLLISAGTYALFSDLASSAGNEFVAGNIVVQLKDNNEVWGDNVNATWTASNIKPGDVYPFGVEQVEIRNSGTTLATTVDFTAVNHVDDPPGPSTDSEENTTDMDQVAELTFMEYEDGAGPVDLLSLLTDANGNGWKDLDDLEQAPITGVAAPIGTGRYQMSVRIRPEADNDYQGDTLVADLVFRLNE